MATFGTELLEEMECIHAEVKADNARLEVQVIELEAQKRQLVLEVEAQRIEFERHGLATQLLKAELVETRRNAELHNDAANAAELRIVELRQELAESRMDTKVGYRLYDAAEQRVVELRDQLAELREAATGVCESASLVDNVTAEVSSEQVARLMGVLGKVKP